MYYDKWKEIIYKVWDIYWSILVKNINLYYILIDKNTYYDLYCLCMNSNGNTLYVLWVIVSCVRNAMYACDMIIWVDNAKERLIIYILSKL